MGIAKNKRYLAAAAVPDKLLCICDVEYRIKDIFIALYILTASGKSKRNHFHSKIENLTW